VDPLLQQKVQVDQVEEVLILMVVVEQVILPR
jgi:hypothetical protein